MVERAQENTHWCDKEVRFEELEELPDLVKAMISPCKIKCSVCDEENSKKYREDEKLRP